MDSRDKYNKIKALNWSTLKVIGVSPLAFKRNLEITREDTPAMALGRAVHAAILEPDHYDAAWAVWHGGVKRGKEWEAFKSEHMGAEIITADQAALVDVLVSAVSQHREARNMLEGARTEVNVEWSDVEIQCKGRLDIITSAGQVVDLKTTSRTSLRDIRRQAAAADYHGQLAWYHDGAIRGGVLPADAELPRLIYVQTVEPFDCFVDRLSQATLEAGRDLYRAYLALYRECSAADYWPGMLVGEGEWDLPAWAANKAFDVDGGEL